ncbi:hypothetical protein RND71_003585 [Anisodus tanguticus]|uniref:non-specific serine/threonine protein kinase n=1 Tax=Anisodus tanguticus TaxID=243964 RepID=A0AAE1VWS1_9SOLA|nr:hypothetical protein RND71_003585 [Anisodus tanguticus]
MGLDMDDSHTANRDDYYNNKQNGNWNNNNVQSTENVVKIPPPIDSAGVSSEYNWTIAPPPPPPPMRSSSSAIFSGAQQQQKKNPNLPRLLDDEKIRPEIDSKANLLGQGGFGFVHKGVLPNGKEIAVKSLKSNSGHGEREFQAEAVSIIDILCHPRIIHRDIKGANILLDNNFEAKVADFGLAKLAADNFTHVSTRIMGTFGYLAPEYASTGKLTEKSDGVMLLELITGHRPIDVNSE